MRIIGLRKQRVKTLQLLKNLVKPFFIDDLTATNDGENFEKTLHTIYPPDRELKQEKHCTFSIIGFKSGYQNFA